MDRISFPFDERSASVAPNRTSVFAETGPRAEAKILDPFVKSVFYLITVMLNII